MTSRNILLLALAIALSAVGLTVAPLSATAGDDDKSIGEKIEGTFKATRSQSTARKRINKQIEKVVQKMSIVKRPFARGQLKENTAPCSKMTFKYSSNQISIQCDSEPPAKSKPDGTTTTYKGADGETHQLSQTVGNGRVVQHWESENGSRTNIYRLSGEDTLIMGVRLKSSQLPEDITYNRAFIRQ